MLTSEKLIDGLQTSGHPLRRTSSRAQMPRILRSAARVPAKIIQPKRTSPRERGYDARWDRRSVLYRRRHPFCENPVHGDRVVFGDVVDHKLPVVDGGQVHCPDEGLWHLCKSCHDGFKREAERIAREINRVDLLPLWCDNPEARPERLKKWGG